MRKWIHKLTLNYLLMPEYVMKKGVVFQPKHFGANLDQTYRFKKSIMNMKPHAQVI